MLKHTVLTMSTSTNRTVVTFSTSTEGTNTQEQEVNNSPAGVLERYKQGEKGELLLGNGYGYRYSSNLDIWPILSLLPSEFISQIHMIMPLHKDAVFIVTNDKMVYALGTDQDVMSQIGSDYQPVKIEQLCGKNVYFIYYEVIIFALTEEGEVYAWGNDDKGRLGLGLKSHDIILTPTKVSKLSEEHTIKMAFAFDHGIALTKDGKVYNWGSPDYENLINRPKGSLPWQVEFDSLSDSDRITHVSCGFDFNVAVTKNGNVYSWGENNYGSLGLYDNCNGDFIITQPSKISSLKDIVIDKAVCGYCHTLALTAIGELYVWGHNENRQLGYDTENDFSTIPTKLNVPEMGKIVDIFAYENLSAAINDKKHVYVWGLFHNKVIPVPTPTNLSNMYNIFIYEMPYIILH